MAATLALVPVMAMSLTQPNGTPIPQGGSLESILRAEGEMIDVMADAADVPETFSPACTMTFRILANDTAGQDSFGWYNVVPDRAPTADELHVMIPAGTPVGTEVTLDLRGNPDYLGGEIGFFLDFRHATIPNAVYYSQKEYNPDYIGPGESFIHLIIYNSLVDPTKFYFAWEDWYGSGDNDFNDLVTSVTNIVCSGGGGPCDTGELGVCASGTEQCRAGVLQCLRDNDPNDERCDGLDNDCDGTVDEGDLCAANEVCDRGKCVQLCGSGNEFLCPWGLECNSRNVCVEPECLEVDCPEGQVCRAGDCVEPCTGIVCPWDHVCRFGRCVDPCDELMCDEDYICIHGVCTVDCECSGCDEEETCSGEGICVETRCLDVDCPEGFFCDGGTCFDGCTGAVCPAGQDCELGTCVDVPPPPDRDGDTIPDDMDNCPDVGNPTQTDTDGDTIGDPCDSTPYPVDASAESEEMAEYDAVGDGGTDVRDGGVDIGQGAAEGCSCRMLPGGHGGSVFLSGVLLPLLLLAWRRRPHGTRRK